MKELLIKEKAQAYDEAVEKAKSKIKNDKDHVLYEDDIIEIFPELKESEDEKIRKELIDFVRSRLAGFPQCDKYITWLERQGEQKSIDDLTQQEAMDIAVAKCFEQGEQKTADKVEPKFKVGDTVTVKPMSCHGKVFKSEPFKIVDIIEDNYVSDDGKTYSISLQDGWELVEHNPAWSEEDEDNFKHLLDEIVCLGNNRNSANRLYYDRLIKFIEELKNRAQPKEKWCDKDERMLDRLIAYFEKQVTFTDDDNPRYANWLKSLKGRVQLQPKQEWSEEDEERLSDAIFFVREYQIPTRDKRLLNAAKETEDWLKTLNPQNKWKPSDEQMNALNDVISSRDIKYDVLSELWLDLNKLREE